MTSAVLMWAIVMVAAAFALAAILKEMLFPSDDMPPPTCCRCGKKIVASDGCRLPGYGMTCGKCLDDLQMR